MKSTDDKDLLTPRGLERRLKRHLLKKECTFLAITTPGFEKILESEIRSLNAAIVNEKVDGGVIFTGNSDLVYHSNLHLRTANRIIERIGTFTARSYPELYNKSRKIAWELYTGFTKEISFSVTSRNSRLHHTDNIENTVFDAICEAMKKLGVSVRKTKDASIRFFLRFSDDTCTVSIDSSGELLYKRGYRTEVAHAPIRESTASALLIAANWNKYSLIADPMCGSGVFVLEAALLAKKRAPGIGRAFAFEQWPRFNRSRWEKIKKNTASAEVIPEIKLVASDIDLQAIESARKNYQNLNSATLMELIQRNCLDFNRRGEYGEHGLIISNLPYGKRVGASYDLKQLYKKMIEHYRTYCKNWDFGFVCEDKKLLTINGFQAGNEIRFVNGGIPVSFIYGKFT